MVRLWDGIPLNFYIILGGWIISIILLGILIKLNPEFDNQELAEYATLGAIVFFLQSFFIIPINFFGLIFTLSGVPLVVMVKGVKRGLLIASAAIILNHIFIVGAFSMLGVNLSNMLISGLVAGSIPSIIFRKMGSRVRYLSGLFGGIVYFLTLSVLISIELAISTYNITLSRLFYLLIFVVFVVGLFEGFLTAIASSYYYRLNNPEELSSTTTEEDDLDDEEIEPIHFYDE